jgi:hypothetical protein
MMDIFICDNNIFMVGGKIRKKVYKDCLAGDSENETR